MSPDSLGIGRQVSNGLVAAPHKSLMFQGGHRPSVEIQRSLEPCLCDPCGRVQGRQALAVPPGTGPFADMQFVNIFSM